VQRPVKPVPRGLVFKKCGRLPGAGFIDKDPGLYPRVPGVDAFQASVEKLARFEPALAYGRSSLG